MTTIKVNVPKQAEISTPSDGAVLINTDAPKQAEVITTAGIPSIYNTSTTIKDTPVKVAEIAPPEGD